MKLLIKQATLVEKGNKFHGATKDLLIIDGTIAAIESVIDEPADEVIDASGKFVSLGWIDGNVSFSDPGFEYKEDLTSGLQLAAASGFTEVVIMPETEPAIDNKSVIQYIQQKSSQLHTHPHVVGCITIKREGKDLAELYDMQQAGAIAFSDSSRPIQDSGLMSRALLYAKGLNTLLQFVCEDKGISGNGKMHEGIASTYLGMKGIPSLAETLMIERVLALAEYHQAKVHISQISCEESVQLIAAAKNKKLEVSCDVSINHLLLNDEALDEFDTNLKLLPPLRSEKDRLALIAGLKSGVIDYVSSQHRAQHKESKEVEFEIASYGMIGIQTFFPNLLDALIGFNLEDIIELITIKPRRVLGLEVPSLLVGNVANLTIFDPDHSWNYTLKNNLSKSENSFYLNSELKGAALAMVRGSKFLTTNV